MRGRGVLALFRMAAYQGCFARLAGGLRYFSRLDAGEALVPLKPFGR
jgi:hypothetical protein